MEDLQHILCFDTETTGLPRNFKAPASDIDNWPRMVQLGYLFYDSNENLIESGDKIIKPVGFEIPKAASDIHGITHEKAMEEGEDLLEVVKHFTSLIDKSHIIVGHNLDFDTKIVGAEMIRNYVKATNKESLKICTMKSTTDFCQIPGPYGYKWPKLQELHKKLFGEEFEDAHNAFSDVKATAKCYWELKKLGVIDSQVTLL